MSRARISNYRKGVAAIALSAVLAGGFVATGPIGALNDARADAVQVTPPPQAAGFADLVEKVRPAVVSVRVKKDVQQLLIVAAASSPALRASISFRTTIRSSASSVILAWTRAAMHVPMRALIVAAPASAVPVPATNVRLLKVPASSSLKTVMS